MRLYDIKDGGGPSGRPLHLRAMADGSTSIGAVNEAGGSAVEVVTFGCRLNAYESEVIRARAAEDGLTDAVVLNTCAVTGEAVRQARQAIRRLGASGPARG